MAYEGMFRMVELQQKEKIEKFLSSSDKLITFSFVMFVSSTNSSIYINR